MWVQCNFERGRDQRHLERRSPPLSVQEGGAGRGGTAVCGGGVVRECEGVECETRKILAIHDTIKKIFKTLNCFCNTYS